jgi:hypothetical protein
LSILQKQPGATPAQPVADSDPAQPSTKNDFGVLTGKESFEESMEKVSLWAGIQSKS